MTDEPLPVDVKTLGQLIDELCIENNKIFQAIERLCTNRGDGQKQYLQDQIQDHNKIRRELVRAIDRRLGERDIGGRI